MEEITLNLIPTGVRPTCHVSQNDNERDIKINLVEGSLAYVIKSGDIVKLNIRKPNDVVISSRITATVGNTYVIANIKDEMCNVDGTNLCEIRIINGDTRISTSNFLMEVEIDPSANGGGGGGGASNLADLDDVNISEPSDGQVLKYNGTSEMWENGTGGGGGASAMSDLTDVDLTGLEDGNSLVYDDDDDEWKVQTITKEVTQAEYDALVQAGTVDPKTAYFIKDTNGDGQDFQPVIYSLEEREIGVWTDGKPLYEKTFVLDGSSTTFIGENVINHNISNIDVIVKADGFINMDWSQYGGGGEPIFNTGLDGNTNNFSPSYANCLKDINGTTFTVVIGSGRLSQGINNVVVTIRYTKTTDQAGSGTWTPQGVPAVHYSTDEKIVGTWIDGSIVYEKCIVLNNGIDVQVSNTNWTNTGVTFAGVGIFIDAFGIGNDGSYQGQILTYTDNDILMLQTPRNAVGWVAILCIRYTKTSS